MGKSSPSVPRGGAEKVAPAPVSQCFMGEGNGKDSPLRSFPGRLMGGGGESRPCEGVQSATERKRGKPPRDCTLLQYETEPLLPMYSHSDLPHGENGEILPKSAARFTSWGGGENRPHVLAPRKTKISVLTLAKTEILFILTKAMRPLRISFTCQNGNSY